jgi:hypothetical protein
MVVKINCLKGKGNKKRLSSLARRVVPPEIEWTKVKMQARGVHFGDNPSYQDPNRSRAMQALARLQMYRPGALDYFFFSRYFFYIYFFLQKKII